MARPFEALRARRLAEVNARYAEELAKGFPTATFEGQPGPETLQCRNELDRTNWLGLVVKCQATMEAERRQYIANELPVPDVLGDYPMDIPIRTTANRNYFVTYADALGRMFALLQQAAQAQANWWRLKDEVRRVPSAELGGKRGDLRAIDLDAGWS